MRSIGKRLRERERGRGAEGNGVRRSRVVLGACLEALYYVLYCDSGGRLYLYCAML